MRNHHVTARGSRHPRPRARYVGGMALRSLRLSLLVAAVGLQGAALYRYLRQPPGSRAALDLIAAVDVDNDGRVSPSEYERVGDGDLAFAYVDADHDGELTPWEVDVIIRHISPLRASLSWVPRAL
jgi:hypothetical protein